MDIYSFFYKGKWYQIGDTIILNWIQKWKIVDILDGSVALLERGKKYKSINGKVRIGSY